MATTKKKKGPCGHSTDVICVTCSLCKTCETVRTSDLLSTRAKLSHMTTSLGESEARAERLRQLMANGAHRPEERDERDLAIARMALLRHRLEALLAKELDVHETRKELEEALQHDDVTRTRSIEEVVQEAVSLNKKKPTLIKHILHPKHPAWDALEDDDWNGATFSNLLNSFKPGTVVVLVPGGRPAEQVERMKTVVGRFAKVEVQ